MQAVTLQSALREYRKAHQLLQKEVAARLGISSKHYSRIEEGKESPSMLLLRKICETTGIVVHYYLLGDRPPRFLTQDEETLLFKFNRANGKTQDLLLTLLTRENEAEK